MSGVALIQIVQQNCTNLSKSPLSEAEVISSPPDKDCLCSQHWNAGRWQSALEMRGKQNPKLPLAVPCKCLDKP